jgi:hypothetical protein
MQNMQAAEEGEGKEETTSSSLTALAQLFRRMQQNP